MRNVRRRGEERRGPYSVLVWKPKVRRPSGRPRRGRKVILKWIFK
jgi:hypothetical protein